MHSLIEFIGNILVATAVTDFFVNGLYFCEFWSVNCRNLTFLINVLINYKLTNYIQYNIIITS